MSTGSNAIEYLLQPMKKIQIICNNPSGLKKQERGCICNKIEIAHKRLNIRTTLQVVALEVYLLGKIH